MAGCTVEFSSDFFSSHGIARSELRGIRSVAARGFLREERGECLSFRFFQPEVRHLDRVMMLGGIEEELYERVATIFGGGVVERNAVLIVVDFVIRRESVASDAAEVVEMSTSFLGEGLIRSWGRFVFFESSEISCEVGCILRTFRSFVIHHGRHGGGWFEFIGLGDPADEPFFGDAIANVGEVGAGVDEFGHGEWAKVSGFVAFGAVMGSDEVGGVDGGVTRFKSSRGHGLAGEGFALSPEEAERTGTIFGGLIADFESVFARVEAEAFGFSGAEIAFYLKGFFSVDEEGSRASSLEGESEAGALFESEGSFKICPEGSRGHSLDGGRSFFDQERGHTRAAGDGFLAAFESGGKGGVG